MKTASIIVLLFFLQSSPVRAEDGSYTIKTYASFAALKADAAKSCELISHDCEVCAVSEDHKLVCSSVGTACEPKEWRCYEKKLAPH